MKREISYAVKISMDYIDFNLSPWDQENHEIPGKKKEITVYDQNILRKMYMLKQLFDNSGREQSATPNRRT